MLHPKDTFCGVYEHVYTLFSRDDTLRQKPYAYLDSDINSLRCFLLFFDELKNHQKQRLFILI